ncbi:hypothetical protein SK128_005605, partial [Halocaridina rubra]
HSRLLVQLLQLFMPCLSTFLPLLRTRRKNNGRRRPPPPSRLHRQSIPPILHASPATTGMTWEGALLLTALVTTVAIRFTGPGLLDAQPRVCKVEIATRLAATTDVSRKRTRVWTALQSP